MDEEQEQ